MEGWILNIMLVLEVRYKNLKEIKQIFNMMNKFKYKNKEVVQYEEMVEGKRCWKYWVGGC